MQNQARLGCINRKFKARLIMASSSKISILFFFIISNLAVTQTDEDLSYLDLLPSDQAQSIAEKLGVQTGKPVSDEIKVDTIDTPSFSSLKPKSESTFNTNLSLDSFSNKNIFGLNLFKDSPTTFAPIDLAPAPREYVLGPGDEIRVQLFGTQSVNRLIPINREGNIIIAEIGDIQVSGLTFEEAEERIKSVVDASLIGVDAEISLAKIRSIQVFVLGNSFSPGAYTVSSLSNISNILFFSGGPTENGSLRNIDVKRAGKIVSTFDFYDLLVNGNTIDDVRLQSNDAIVINPIGKKVKNFWMEKTLGI
jgi:polysaccharide export outer membrane protein